MLIGYARVSTLEQSLSLQTDALTAAGCIRIFSDRLSGAKSDRPGLASALDMSRSGDTLVVWKLDRLGRSVQHLTSLVADFKFKGLQLRSLTDAIDTSSVSGMFFFNIMASLADMERALAIERTRAGLVAAKARGRVGGRPRAMTDSKIAAAKSLAAGGMLPRDIAASLGVSVPTLYRWVPAQL